MKTIHINFCVEQLENRLLLSQGAFSANERAGSPSLQSARIADKKGPRVSASDSTLSQTSGSLTFGMGNLANTRLAPVAVTLGTKAFIAGGTDDAFNRYDTVDIYDAALQTWSVKHLSVPRYGAAAAAVGTKVLFAGGGVDDGRSVDVYNSTTESWSLANLSVPRYGGSAATIGQKVYFAGLERNATRIVDIYDDATGRWTTMKAPRRFADSAGHSNITGSAGAGIGGIAIFVTADIVQAFNSTTSRWQVFKLRHSMLYPKVSSIGSKAIFSDNNGSVVTYDDLTGKITQNHTAILSRSGYAVGTVGNYTLYRGGEGADFGNVINVYNNVTGIWEVASLSNTRAEAVGIAVGNTVLFAGGITNDPISESRVHTSTVDIVHIDTSLLTGGLTGRPGHTVTVQVFNTGDAPLATGTVVKLYATRARGIIDGSSILLGSKPTTSPLAANDNRTLRVSTKIPGTMVGGSYYLVAAVDDGKTVTPIASSETSYKITTKTTAAISRAFTRLFHDSNLHSNVEKRRGEPDLGDLKQRVNGALT